jgi:hypothetical protein
MVFSKNPESHKKHLKEILTKLQLAGLKINGEKCQWFKKDIKFLGFIVSDDGIRSDPAKTEAIRTWPTPTTQKALQRFLGLCAFYQKVHRASINEGGSPISTIKEGHGMELVNEGRRRFRRIEGKVGTPAGTGVS